jgi:secondary thiamine-phosphate synthase enzyme
VLAVPVETHYLEISTRGICDVIDISDKVEALLGQSSIQNGVATLFMPGSTAGLTTIEYESGCIDDLKRKFEELVPQDAHYDHNSRWGDGNGYAHIRAALLGASLQVPFQGKRLLTGTWQQIILVDFDNRPRQRRIIAQLIGE